jgi:hypothetical protein
MNAEDHDATKKDVSKLPVANVVGFGFFVMRS